MDFPWQLIADFSAGGLVVAFIIAILTGKLIPVNILKEIKYDRDLWRDTALTRERSLETTLVTVKDTHETAKITLDLVRELRDVSKESYSNYHRERSSVKDEKDT